MAIDQKTIRDLLDYDPETGVFTWRVHRQCIRAGSVAGHRENNGYTRIKINGHKYMAHLLAWLWMTGEFAPRGIDHRDGDGHNNKWSNLRRATRSQNMANRRIHSNNTHGFKGVRKRTGKFYRRPYMAVLTVNGKIFKRNGFRTAEEAHAAYCEMAKEHFDEFARD